MVRDFFSGFMDIKNNQHVAVLQTKIWFSTYSRCLATGQVKPDLQERGNEDLSHGDHPAQLPQYQVGDSRLDMNTILDQKPSEQIC